MHHEPAYKPHPEPIITHVSTAVARQGFAVLKDEFETRTAGFFIAKEKPDIALIEINRSFLQKTLQASIVDINMDANFKASDLTFPKFSAMLQPFDAGDMICKPLDCSSSAMCQADLTQCKRLRDTRECSTCLFRNPLNNRCAKEEVDPVCESDRSLQNARYDAERSECISRAETLKRECDDMNALSLLNCQLESDNDYSNCESVKSGIRNLESGTSLASISARTRANGLLTANFSNLRIEGNLERIKLDMGLKSDLQLEGELKFKPDGPGRPLAACIATWSTPFSSQFMTMPAVNKLVSNLQVSGRELTANWSGFGLTINAQPSPLASILLNKSRMLSGCNIGLTIRTVEGALTGNDSAFFLGQLDLEIQPQPTTIHFAPALITLGDRVYSGDARLSNKNLRYEITD